MKSFRDNYLREFSLSKFEFLMLLGFSSLILISIVFGEKTFIGGGFGWDGVAYASWVRDFPAVLFNRLDSYHIVRILPSAAVNMMMRLFKVELTNSNILVCWQTFNFLMGVISVFIILKISAFFHFTKQSTILILSILIFNVGILKLYIWNPVITDISVFAFTLVLFYAFLKNFKGLIVLISILGFFTWPSFFILGMILYLFPYRVNSNKKNYFSTFLESKSFNTVIGFSLGIAIVALCIYYSIYYCFEFADNFYASPIVSLYWLSLGCIVVYLYYAYMRLIFRPKILPQIYSSIDLSFIFRFSATLVLYITLTLIKSRMITSENGIHGLDRYLAMTFNFPFVRPLSNIVAHTVWFGPVFILILYYSKQIFNKINIDGGLGVMIIMTIGLLMSLNSESRMLITFVPLLCFYLVSSIGNYITRKQVIIIIISQLVFSKIWYKINWGTIDEWINPLEFPAQHCFMNAGPWMSHQMFLINCLAIFAVILLFFRFRMFAILKN